MSSPFQDKFFRSVISKNAIRPRVACIVIKEGKLLVQQAADDAAGFYAFLGGEYEVGDTFESRIRIEFKEELGIPVSKISYLFVLENRFTWNGHLIHGLEHFHFVEIDAVDVTSQEEGLAFHWLPVDELKAFDVRPHIVRDLVADGRYHEVSHLVV